MCVVFTCQQTALGLNHQSIHRAAAKTALYFTACYRRFLHQRHLAQGAPWPGLSHESVFQNVNMKATLLLVNLPCRSVLKNFDLE